jgi:hypothetical protein
MVLLMVLLRMFVQRFHKGDNIFIREDFYLVTMCDKRRNCIARIDHVRVTTEPFQSREAILITRTRFACLAIRPEESKNVVVGEGLALMLIAVIEVLLLQRPRAFMQAFWWRCFNAKFLHCWVFWTLRKVNKDLT